MEPSTVSTGLLAPLLLLPLLSGLLAGTVGRLLPRSLTGALASGAVGVSFLLSLVATFTLHGLPVPADGFTPPTLTQDIAEWLAIGSLQAPFALSFDAVTAVMCLVITGVGFLIHVYSIGYMHDDPGFARYFAYLNLFVCAMLALVLADNLIVLFLGWEGVGVASYLLIGFWYSDDDKVAAGNKAFIANRVGDLGLMLGVFLLFGLAGTVSIAGLRDWVAALSTEQLAAAGGLLTLATMLLFLGCTGKSAQIPLFVWLPDAMAGPTPVSALIHAATMVTAGVYLIVRLNFVFALAPVTMHLIAVVGLLTALLAGSIGLVQTDIKKVLAYSTVSQLGFMFLAAGSGAITAALFHVVTHAFFKALLFLGSGSVIHALGGEQDIRKMGALAGRLPATHATFLIGCLAIAGFPLTAGFFSKDEILWGVLAGQHALAPSEFGSILYVLALAAALLTAVYMFRLYLLVFRGSSRVEAHAAEHLHESPAVMTVPLWILAGLSLVAGFAGLPHVVSDAVGVPNLFHHWIAPVVAPMEALIHTRFESSGAAWGCVAAGTTAGLAGIALAWTLWSGDAAGPARAAAAFPRLHRLLAHKYYVDEAYALVLGRSLDLKSRVLHRVVDAFGLDLLLFSGTGWLVAYTGKALSRFQDGNVQRYAAFALVGLAVIFAILAV